MPGYHLHDETAAQRKALQEAQGGNRAVHGLSRFGDGDIGGGGFGPGRQARQPDGESGVDIHHVTLPAVSGQTIAAGGSAVAFGSPAGPPTERRGFTKLATALKAGGGQVVAIPADITGLRQGFAHLIFADDVTATVTISRIRNGVETVLEEYEGTGIQWFDGSSLQIRSGDTTVITVDPDSDVDVVWGRIFVDDFGTASPTTRDDPQTVWEQTDEGLDAGADWPDDEAVWIWTDVDGLHPIETGYMAQTFWLPEAGDVRVWASLDNEGEVYVDGTLLLTETNSTTILNVKGVVSLAAGRHTVAVEARNVDDNTPAAARVAVYTHVGGVDDELLLRTTEDWHGWTSEPVGWPNPSLSGGS
jgi:hypothetical protein